METKPKFLANGALLKKYAGSTVHVWLETSGSTSTGGHQVQGTTSDGKRVTVHLDSPLNQPLEGWIEVIGIPASDGSSINCHEIIVFPTDENSEPFDKDAHNGMVFAMDNMRDFDDTGDNF